MEVNSDAENNQNTVVNEDENNSDSNSIFDDINLNALKTNTDSENKKKKKRGIIYLSQIPKYMNVLMIREIFSKYGDVGRVYLQLAQTPDDKKSKKRKKKLNRHFTEGWVEFESKRVAKFVAATLNNKQISSRKRSKFFDVIWNIKYLPRFKWIHLSERLAYEKAVHKQRLNAEISQAKREVNFFSYNVDRSKKLRAKQAKGEGATFTLPNVKQRDTDMEIRVNKKKNSKNNSSKGVSNNDNDADDRTEFLKSLFA